MIKIDDTIEAIRKALKYDLTSDEAYNYLHNINTILSRFLNEK